MTINHRLKATPEQQRLIHDLIQKQTTQMNLKVKALCTIGDCWVLFQRYLRQISQREWDGNFPRIWPYTERPLECGTHREWLFKGLNDIHLESVFRHVVKQYKPEFSG